METSTFRRVSATLAQAIILLCLPRGIQENETLKRLGAPSRGKAASCKQIHGDVRTNVTNTRRSKTNTLNSPQRFLLTLCALRQCLGLQETLSKAPLKGILLSIGYVAALR